MSAPRRVDGSRRRLLKQSAAFAGVAALPWPADAQDSGAVSELERLRADLAQHASYGPKFSGSPGDHANAAWIADRLTAAGYRVERPEFDAPFFVAERTELQANDQTADVIAQAPVVPTGPGGLSAPLRLIESEADVGSVRDTIALFSTPSGRHAALFPTRGIGQTVRAAHEAGARAIVIVTNGPSGEAVALNCPEEPFVPIPVAILAPKRAAPFIAAAREGRDATLTTAGNATRRPCANIVARLERGPHWIAISTPRSGWFGCVAERGTGTAVFLELAAWARTRFPEHSIFLMNTGGHEYFFAGSHRVVDRGPPPEATDVWCHVGATLAARDAEQRNGDWIMLDRADPFRYTMASAAARDATVTAFAGLSGLDETREIRPQAGELSTFTDLGYERAFAAIGQHRWFHTIADTLDCVDAGLLMPVLRAHQRGIELNVAAAGAQG